MAFLITAWTTLLWLASATGLDPTLSAGSLSFPGQSIDLLRALGLPNNSWEGVTLRDGPKPRPRWAYQLQGNIRDMKLPTSSFRQVSDLLRSTPEFTIFVRLKQETGNTGTIISFAYGVNRYLELQSSGRKNEIRLHYTVKADSKVHVETFRYCLADDRWHDVAVSVSGPEVELLVDCKSLFKRDLAAGPPNRNFSEPIQLWIGQRNSRSYHFKGLMHEVRLIGRPFGYLESCPDLDTHCPTCGQFFLLQNTVHELTRHLKELSERLVAAESRITEVEQCDCNKSCYSNDSIYADGAKWENGCNDCYCVHGDVKCHPRKCPEPTCKHPVVKQEECCPFCLNNCLFHDQFYDHGEVVTFKKCLDCRCDNGVMKCGKVNQETYCPKLNCPPEKQFSVPDHCCKFCPDIDECQQEGGLEGHHCHQNTKCVNTPGSYECECLPGHRRIDKFNCAELDECSSGKHNCHVNAECINTKGSYHCECKEGYSGNGFSCQPVCNQKCLNGGNCSSPGRCACANGYTGNSCELDLDECATNSHRCTNSSECVNMIGWYYCQCKEGFNSSHIDNYLGTKCLDINECNSDLHTCHPSAQCVNIDGGFRCECPTNTTSCRLSCMFEDREVLHGVSVSPKNDSCRSCTCDKGVITCAEPKCDCSLPGSGENPCCPQCNTKHACRHQELPEVILRHGEQWSYQCQNCECLYGEIDCWNMKCPPLLCNNPVSNPEDCCPHCEDLCPLGAGNTSASEQSCLFEEKFYESGSHIIDPKDPCTACDCKDGILCCSYIVNCGDDPRPVGYDGVVAPKDETANSASAPTDVAKQSSVLRLATHSAGFYNSDSRGNETRGTPPGG